MGCNSLTRGQTWAPCIGSKSLSHWTTRKDPCIILIKLLYLCCLIRVSHSCGEGRTRRNRSILLKRKKRELRSDGNTVISPPLTLCPALVHLSSALHLKSCFLWFPSACPPPQHDLFMTASTPKTVTKLQKSAQEEITTNLDSILKSRDITLLTKVHLVKAMVFPVVMYGCESWTIKKAEHRRIDALEPWCWRRLLRVPWTARRSNQSILKEISPEYSLEELMLKLKLQYFGHLIQRTDSFEKTLMLGKIEGRRRRG
ncbi:hypothetical protein FD755_000183 [Muntiacus reevesi]|uniref:Endonuclease-reverse transcriptase n=1 Tax=Muntiacus reevesi TaxID=9886 RepID=A0A5J5MXW2_MUNRE|nr:hypothetical protein FD755_000183 [Muntiacus reevesi]